MTEPEVPYERKSTPVVRANELRIGNLVYYNDENLQPEKTAIKVSVEDIKILFYKEKYHHYEPIPLTEEWLLKLRTTNIIQVKHKEYIEIDRFTLVYQKQYNFWYVYTDSEEELAYITKVEFVHEWQNVYFALNGEELTLTEHPTPAS